MEEENTKDLNKDQFFPQIILTKLIVQVIATKIQNK
jgi:hypothetical protein